MGTCIPIEFDRESPGKFDSRTHNRKTLNRWTGRGEDAMNEAVITIVIAAMMNEHSTPGKVALGLDHPGGALPQSLAAGPFFPRPFCYEAVLRLKRFTS